MKKIRICIVGLGPWGLGSLERIISRASRDESDTEVIVDVVEPGEPGVGVHFRDLPDHILLNTKCSHISMFIENQFTDISNPIVGPTLLEWVKEQGYNFNNDGYGLTTEGGREIVADDFIPRRLLGEYLNWFYQDLTKRIPKNVNLTIHKQTAVDMEVDESGFEIIILDNEVRINSDVIFITTGHTKNNKPVTDKVNKKYSEKHISIDYPLKKHLTSISSSDHVGVAGFGLAAFDVLTELTIGRGGKYIFNKSTGKRKYYASGNEPTIYMFSRSGIPPCSRPAISKSVESFGYDARFFTPEIIDAIREKKFLNQGADKKLDFEKELLPLLWDEMKLVYYETTVRLSQGDEKADSLVYDLVTAWPLGEFDKKIAALSKVLGSFDPEKYFNNPFPDKITDSNEYQELFSNLMREDLIESYKGEIKSSNKSAFELFRVVRDTIRYAVDFEGLSPDSLLQFKKRTASMINRIIVGPPKERPEEMLALIDAGIVHIPFGPSPDVIDDESGKIRISSTKIEKKYSKLLDKIIYAYIPHATVNNSSSEFIANLYKKGRLRDYKIGDVSLGSVHIDEDLHPINMTGEMEKSIYMLGPLTEGVKYFNHYIPSPSSRVRAFRDADKCVKKILYN